MESKFRPSEKVMFDTFKDGNGLDYAEGKVIEVFYDSKHGYNYRIIPSASYCGFGEIFRIEKNLKK